MICESLYSELIDALQKSDYDLETKWQLLDLAINTLKKSSSDLKESHSAKIYALVLPLLSASDTTPAQQKSAKEFLHHCTNCVSKYLFFCQKLT